MSEPVTTHSAFAAPEMLTQPADAIAEMVIALTRDFALRFEPGGLHQLVRNFYVSVGAYLEKFGAVVPDVDLWFDPDFQDIREFVMNFAVPQLGAALVSWTSSGSTLDSAAVATVMTSVMTRRDVEVHCGRATTNFERKIPVGGGDPTPICHRAP